jgi:hypothetical protein
VQDASSRARAVDEEEDSLEARKGSVPEQRLQDPHHGSRSSLRSSPSLQEDHFEEGEAGAQGAEASSQLHVVALPRPLHCAGARAEEAGAQDPSHSLQAPGEAPARASVALHHSSLPLVLPHLAAHCSSRAKDPSRSSRLSPPSAHSQEARAQMLVVALPCALRSPLAPSARASAGVPPHFAQGQAGACCTPQRSSLDASSVQVRAEQRLQLLSPRHSRREACCPQVRRCREAPREEDQGFSQVQGQTSPKTIGSFGGKKKKKKKKGTRRNR